MALLQDSPHGPPAVIPFRFPGVPNVSACFTTALYGDIRLDAEPAAPGGAAVDAKLRAGVKKRRAALASLLGFASWTELRQVHGDTVLLDPEPTPFDAPSALEADGSATSRPRHALLAKAADCQQILLAHKSGKYVAALHCGWRGNALNFPGGGLGAFCRAYGLAPRDVLAVRGPSLGPGAAEFVNFASEWPERFRPWFNPETARMDLWSLTRHQLSQAGMLPENIFSIDLCTHTLCDFLYSHRRGSCGRQAALIFMES